MTGTLNFKKIVKTMRIYLVVQVVLVALLVLMAVYFQTGLQAVGRGAHFMNGVIASLVIQLILFYPIFKFAGSQAARDIDMTATNLSKEQLKQFAKKGRIGEAIKVGVFCFFIVFILRVPKEQVFLSIIYFSFILTMLTYFQCYNFAAKKIMKEKGAAN